MNAIRSHRAPPGPTAKLGAGALVVAAIAVGGLFNSYTPDTDRRERPFVRTGVIGERIDARRFDATVLGVRGTTKITRSRKTYDTAGVWVVVKVRLVARAEPMLLGYAAVRDSEGRLYVATERFDQPLTGGRQLQPSIPAEGEIAFEVPRAVASGLAIRLSYPALKDLRMEAVAEVPLDITPTTVDSWTTPSVEPISIENATVAAT